MVWRGEAAAALRASLHAVLHLFADDGDRVPDRPPAASLRLPEEADTLLQALQGAAAAAGAAAPDAAAADPLDPPALADAGGRAGAGRRCAVRPPPADLRAPAGRGIPAALGEARAVGGRDRRGAGCRSGRCGPTRWLFRRLTRTLDRRMLALLAAPAGAARRRAVRPNLNVASILSPEFLRFDAALPAALRGQVVLDLMPADIMADPAAFLFARDFARDARLPAAAARRHRRAAGGVPAAPHRARPAAAALFARAGPSRRRARAARRRRCIVLSAGRDTEPRSPGAAPRASCCIRGARPRRAAPSARPGAAASPILALGDPAARP